MSFPVDNHSGLESGDGTGRPKAGPNILVTFEVTGKAKQVTYPVNLLQVIL